MRIVVAGGGYAGLACLARLAGLLPDAERHLLDPGEWHLRRTRLHEVLRRPLHALRADFGELARRHGFRHHRVALPVTPRRLAQWSAAGRLPVGRREMVFDALVVATGWPRPKHAPATSGDVLSLEALARGPGVRWLKRLVREPGPVWVVGAGASGLQCLFELAAVRSGAPLGLVEAEAGILAHEPARLRREVLRRLEAQAVTVRTGHWYLGHRRGRIRLREGRREHSEPAAGVLLCTGPAGDRLEADAAGRLWLDGRVLPRVYATGDCARWRGVRWDAATAQTAVRKGRHVADTIARLARGRPARDWEASQLGFFLSLGPRDAVGWAFHKAALVRGLPALAAREAIERRWELLLGGVDTFGAL